VAEKLGIDLVWFGVLLAINMQTSFMHPPFGFALFYLRSVAPSQDYKDRLTNQLIPKVTTGQIYWGAVPFVVIQIIMVGLVIAFPNLVSGGLGGEEKVNIDNIQIEVPADASTQGDAGALFGTPAASDAAAGGAGAETKKEDPGAALFK
jgi:GntP family gluconate:H+ symporter